MECFYDGGLKFSCTGCRYCCGVEPGYVFLTRDDAERLASHIGICLDEFIKVYCRKVPMGSISYISLLEKEHNDCIFLDDNGCSVYEARPIQCMTYPFWASILESRQTWKEEATSCPGIGKGRLYTREEIDSMVKLKDGVEPMVVNNRD